MKRIGNLYEKIISIDNLRLADKKARLGKSKQFGVRYFDRNVDLNILNLHLLLLEGSYRTSRYTVFKLFEGKEREIFRLPYYPDRIVHHAIMNVLEPIFVKCFTKNTYSCIKNRGIHKVLKDVRVSFRNKVETKYCLKLDIRKFYPSVNHEILKILLRRKFKDRKLLYLLEEIISSADGLPIGNHLSQYFANFYLNGFDHWLKETRKVKHYFRYCDDLVVLSDNKEYLWNLLSEIKFYLSTYLKLSVKDNYKVFPVISRGLDFVGYKIYHDYVLLRKQIKKNFIRMAKYSPNIESFASYKGWLCHCNSNSLINKYVRN